jgi:microsomal epoxide hydrolase
MEHFHIQVAEEVLEDLSYRLEHTKWPSCVEDTGWARGTDFAYMQSLVAYWRDRFDWRAQEAKLNCFSQFQCKVDGINIHFIHERGKGPNPLPIILTHGWPDSYLRYLKLIPLLTDPASYGGSPEDSFDVIIPSLPGFGFSGYNENDSISNSKISEMWAKLMTQQLGYRKFVAGGGDVGSGVTRYLALHHPELLYGIHLTDVGIIKELLNVKDPNSLTEMEYQYHINAQKWIATEGGYMSIQSTKPQTLSYGLTDSPVGLASWIVEKFRAWSDCGGKPRQRFSENELLTNIMIYWVTNTIGSSTSIYYENTHSLPPMSYISVPTGLALFAADIMQPPKEWATRNLNITHWTEIPRGGHFTAMEEPELLADDIRAFCKPFRKSKK